MEVPVVAKQATADNRRRRDRGSINPDDIIAGAFDLAERADDADFEYTLGCILDHAARLIAAGPGQQSKSAKVAPRGRKGSSARKRNKVAVAD